MERERHPKRILMRRLPAARPWRREPSAAEQEERGRVSPLELDAQAHWSVNEIQRSDLAARRNRQRQKATGQAWTRQPGTTVPEMFPGGPEQQGPAAFQRNDAITLDNPMKPLREAMVERCWCWTPPR